MTAYQTRPIALGLFEELRQQQRLLKSQQQQQKVGD